jgi:hypothetical protein
MELESLKCYDTTLTTGFAQHASYFNRGYFFKTGDAVA